MADCRASSCTHIKPFGSETESVSEWKRVAHVVILVSLVLVPGHLCNPALKNAGTVVFSCFCIRTECTSLRFCAICGRIGNELTGERNMLVTT